MQRHGIPTAAFATFDDAARARAYARSLGVPVVVKADGLAAGKGVVIANDAEQADRAIDEMLLEHRFGEAGQSRRRRRILARRGSLRARGVRGRERVGPPELAGSQARVRRRSRSQHGRHGCDRTGAVGRSGGPRACRARDHSPRLGWHDRRRNAVHGDVVCGYHVDGGGTEGARVQHALRRPRNAVADAAPNRRRRVRAVRGRGVGKTPRARRGSRTFGGHHRGGVEGISGSAQKRASRSTDSTTSTTSRRWCFTPARAPRRAAS